MKCYASQTTSSVHNTPARPERSAADNAEIRQVATEFEALLVNIALRPVTKSLGPMSEVIGQQMSMKIAAGMSDPLYDQLRAQVG